MQVLVGKVSGATVADLFAGSGSVGFEALSRGAVEVVFVESDQKANQCLAINIDMAKNAFAKQGLLTPRLQTHLRDVFDSAKLWLDMDIVFADPPYAISLKFTLWLGELLKKESSSLQTIVCEYDHAGHANIEDALRGLGSGWSLKWRNYGRNAFYILERK